MQVLVWSNSYLVEFLLGIRIPTIVSKREVGGFFLCGVRVAAFFFKGGGT